MNTTVFMHNLREVGETARQFEVLLDPTKAFVGIRFANFWVPNLPLEVD